MNISDNINKYSDIKKAFGTDDIRTLQHFVNRGMTESRQAKAEFNVGYYRNNYEVFIILDIYLNLIFKDIYLFYLF